MSFREYLRDFKNLKNLAIFVYMFIAASFNYYLITFNIKYIPGDVFVNAIVSALADAVSHYLSAPLRHITTPKNSLTVSYAMCGIAAIFLMIAENDTSWTKDIPPIILAAKFGISCAFGLLYMCTAHYFDSRFMGSIFGTCNVIARSITILSPMVAEAAYPIPVLCIAVSCLVATVLSRCLAEPSE
jgi:hypothetical protein